MSDLIWVNSYLTLAHQLDERGCLEAEIMSANRACAHSSEDKVQGLHHVSAQCFSSAGVKVTARSRACVRVISETVGHVIKEDRKQGPLPVGLCFIFSPHWGSNDELN